jgi:pimeloyl-ACP methyl ester carboxylesterase
MKPRFLGINDDFKTDEHFRKGLFSAHGGKYEQVFYNWFDGWRAMEFGSWDMRPVLHQINCPALIVQGEEDEHATPKHAIDIAEAIPGAEVWIIQGGRHMLPLENAELFNSRLIQFIKENSIVTSGQGC